jgi:hypothetical protein
MCLCSRVCVYVCVGVKGVGGWVCGRVYAWACVRVPACVCVCMGGCACVYAFEPLCPHACYPTYLGRINGIMPLPPCFRNTLALPLVSSARYTQPNYTSCSPVRPLTYSGKLFELVFDCQMEDASYAYCISLFIVPNITERRLFIDNSLQDGLWALK